MSRRRADREAGFTLLEVVLALTALAMLTAICYAAFHLGMRALEKGEAAVLVRFLGQLGLSRFLVIRHKPDFRWNNPPENNFIDRHVHAKLKAIQVLPSALANQQLIRKARPMGEPMKVFHIGLTRPPYPLRTIPMYYGGFLPMDRWTQARISVSVYRITEDWVPEDGSDDPKESRR